MTERRKPRSYTDEFKQQLVQLHQNGKSIHPYDNAVAEATFKIIKTEFIKGQSYETFILHLVI